MLAWYFCVADFLLISQCLYYNAVNARRAAEAAAASEEAPLLGERRRSRRRSISSEDGAKIAPAGDELIERSSWSSNAACLLGVYVVGFAGWYLSYKAGAYNETDPVVLDDAERSSSNLLEKIGMVLGYFSAVCYLWYASYLVSRMKRARLTFLVLASLRSSRTIAKNHARVSHLNAKSFEFMY